MHGTFQYRPQPEPNEQGRSLLVAGIFGLFFAGLVGYTLLPRIHFIPIKNLNERFAVVPSPARLRRRKETLG
jgi:hypothetical protein